MELRKATRQRAKLRVGMEGVAGSGKTLSALLLASGMAPWEKIAVIDTENGSGDLYANNTVSGWEIGQYNVLPLAAPYTPERYIEAIKECEDAGMEVIIIDSISHEWEGKGGCLESNEKMAQAKFRGNTWAAWSVTTPRHQKFIDAILTSTAHVITTVRSKAETIQTEDKKIKKVGTKAITREGFDYEVTLNFNLSRDEHYATADKDRTTLFIDGDPFKITPETGKVLKTWCESGVDPIKPEHAKPEQEIATASQVDRPRMKELQGELRTRGAKTANEGLEILNKACGTTHKNFTFNEEEASNCLIKLLQTVESKPSKKKSTK